MARRRRAAAEVSLFAFQDVMAAVIGVIFFIVLLMALSIVEARPRTGGVTSETELAALDAQAKALAREAEALRRRLDELERGAVAAGDPARAVGEVRRLHATFVSLNAAIEEVRRGRDEDEAELALREAAVDDRTSEADELDEVLATLRARPRSGPRVSYILDRGPGTPEPWLVELSGDAIRAATQDGAAAVFSFGGPSVSARRERFLAWARHQDRAGSYFVLLIKPTAVDWAYEVAKELDGFGFRFGTDLLPETWQAFE